MAQDASPYGHMLYTYLSASILKHLRVQHQTWQPCAARALGAMDDSQGQTIGCR